MVKKRGNKYDSILFISLVLIIIFFVFILYSLNITGKVTLQDVDDKEGMNCDKVKWNIRWTGAHNSIGMFNNNSNKLDNRFLCLANNYYECGWELNHPDFAVKSQNNQVVESWKCDLNISRWISQASCGNNKCESGETSGNCPNDCSNLCHFFNSINLEDSLGDATPGAPNYVDIKRIEIKQIGQYVQFIWEGNGNLKNNDKQYYFIVFDTDFNPQTGERWNGIGGEIRIIVFPDNGVAIYFDANGNVLKEDFDNPVIFDGNTFYLNIEKNKINSNNFNLYFESSGETPYSDYGSIHKVNLKPIQKSVKLVIESDKTISKNNPPLIAIEKDEIAKLKSYIVQGKIKTLVPQNKITYLQSHPVTDLRIGNISEIVSIDSSGNAKYEKRPGFVLVDGIMNECSLITEKPLIIATGTAFRDNSKDNTIIVFPKDYSTRESGKNTFGNMMQNYPNIAYTWNLAYKLSSKMYGGFKPFKGDKQIFSLITSVGEPENPFACGEGNPLRSDPTCYMHSDGSPEYGASIHEMGHNFGLSKGMQQFVFSDNGRMNRGGECIASLPLIYMLVDFSEHPGKYKIKKESYEYTYFKNKLDEDIPTIYPILNDFESQIKKGEISGYFDEKDTFDRVAVFCDFFQIYAYNLTNDSNQYKQQVIPRFLRIFSDRELPKFIDTKSETYFAAAYSAAIGYDMRTKLKSWGFTIDDAYFEEIYPILFSELSNFSM